MIVPDLQLFAKSAAYQSGRRKSKAIQKYASGSHTQQTQKAEEKKEPEKKEPEKKRKGDAVSALSMKEQYVLYQYSHGEETAVGKGSGEVLLSKLRYDKERGVWVSKSKGTRYIIRRLK